MMEYLWGYRFLISYLIGALPFAVFVPWLFTGLNLLVLGSGNPGTTNVYRVLSACVSKPLAIVVTILVGVLDIGKGWLPGFLFPGSRTIAPLFAVLGHVYSPFLGFAGGKGVGTFYGALLGATGNPKYIIVPLIWIGITFAKATSKLFEVENEWINFGFFKIKVSFFNSLICMSTGMIMLALDNLPGNTFWQFFIILCLIASLHYKHVTLAD